MTRECSGCRHCTRVSEHVSGCSHPYISPRRRREPAGLIRLEGPCGPRGVLFQPRPGIARALLERVGFLNPPPTTTACEHCKSPQERG